MKIEIKITNLRLRSTHSTKGESLGFAKFGTHEVLDIYEGNDYK